MLEFSSLVKAQAFMVFAIEEREREAPEIGQKLRQNSRESPNDECRS